MCFMVDWRWSFVSCSWRRSCSLEERRDTRERSISVVEDELDDNDGDERLSRCDELQLVSFDLLLQRHRLLGISA